jgi:hypothetical protein
MISFDEYRIESDTLQDQILEELVKMCNLFKINRDQWNVIKTTDCLVLTKKNNHYAGVKITNDDVTFESDSIEPISFRIAENKVSYFATTLMMLMKP